MASREASIVARAPAGEVLRLRTSSLFWKVFGKRPTTVVGVAVLFLLSLGAIFAPLIAPYSPDAMNPAVSLVPPSAAHWFGTDIFGRDQLSRVLHGGRISLGIGIAAVTCGILIGAPLGLLAGYYQGWADRIISQYADIMLAFPGFLLALTIVFVLGPNMENVIIAIGISASPTYVRLVRGSVMQVRELPYVEAAQAIGAGDARILLRHILPNVISPVIIVGTLGLGGAILAAAALSFLGAGVQPPTAEWGVMLNEGRTAMRTAWWLTTIPGFVLLLAVLAINLVGDGLRDALDPRR